MWGGRPRFDKGADCRGGPPLWLNWPPHSLLQKDKDWRIVRAGANVFQAGLPAMLPSAHEASGP